MLNMVYTGIYIYIYIYIFYLFIFFIILFFSWKFTSRNFEVYKLGFSTLWEPLTVFDKIHNLQLIVTPIVLSSLQLSFLVSTQTPPHKWLLMVLYSSTYGTFISWWITNHSLVRSWKLRINWEFFDLSVCHFLSDLTVITSL